MLRKILPKYMIVSILCSDSSGFAQFPSCNVRKIVLDFSVDQPEFVSWGREQTRA